MSGIVVSSGVVSSGLVVNSTETLTVLAGGTAFATTVEDVSVIVISSGGYASGAELDDFSVAQVLAGGTASGFNVGGDATEIVSGQVAGGTILGVQGIGDGGTAVDIFVGVGGDQEIISGGVASGSTVSGGTEILFSGATAIGGVIASGGFLTLSGGTETSVTLASGAILTVSSGGTSIATDVGTGAAVTISSGGTAITTTVNSGGLVNIQYGESISSIVNDGGTLMLSSGGTASAATIDAGGTLVALLDGTVMTATVTGGSALLLVERGEVTSGDVSAGGVIRLTSGSVASVTSVASGGMLVISSGGSSVYDAGAGGTELVLAGGRAVQGHMASGGQITDYGSVISYSVSSSMMTVLSGGYFYGGVSFSDLILSGGSAYAYVSGGDTVVSSGGVLGGNLYSGGSVVVSAGGYVSGFDQADSLDNTANGAIEILTNASGSEIETFTNSIEQVFGNTNKDYVLGGTQIIGSGGTATATTLNMGYNASFSPGSYYEMAGTQEVKSGGTAVDTFISAGSELVSAGGVASDTTIVASDTTISEASATMVVYAGATSVDATIFEHGIGYLSGGISINTILSGGSEIVEAGGTAVATTIADGGVLTLDPGAVAQIGITFSDNAADLVVSGAEMPSVTISGFGPADEIDLASVIYRTGASASFSDGILTVAEGGADYDFLLAGNYDSATFDVSRGSAFDTIVTVTSLSCFATGTLIAAEQGEVAVEALKVGDFVRTHDGSLRPIIWIGHRQVDCSRHPDPENILPVRVAAQAFGTNEPQRDLFLSPDHAVFRNGVLIPVKQLVNGTTIRQIKTDRVTYFHIELPQHAVILAEGLAAESYLDTGDRTSFAEGDVTRLHPLFGVALPDRVLVMDALGCAPLRVTGPEVDRVRAQLAARVPAQRATG